ncbi:MAG: UDP-N-acetylglucosamine--N-acetylmuramyl-(pentapeptide) pyrophosphoryl-undecaprenol N-acetylglucosamine transferase [Candidatus Gracilibacteria bacterium]|nr:UDP-N-acetylglucosamine--N-acetylmuramyl-(pentapeptide) pyrophosphoryl-undecaprenol N-acetylglucosamine transferase [Candidatus Gracilibacteria bacterium]MDD3646728.1 UDP-N-acetylglucosamine--N-acetylmuramyl-(pentapeptide) pyrophosphoryl-undecaprenol N-acetylglucosamine transferase [Candidatus Gracilibacteria bacterium]
MENKKTIALTGGSTGGHIFPLLSLYNYLKETGDYNFVWVGEEGSLEEEIAEKNRIPFRDISAGKIRRYFDLRNFYEPLKNLTGIFEGIWYIYKYKIDIVFSKGGYVSLPLSIAARLMGKKLYIHESDTVSGISNKIVERLATKVFYTFPNEKIDGNKYILSGQIINPELIDYIETLYPRENKKLTVIVTGGSQGSTVIFESLLKVLGDLKDVCFHIVLGEKNMHFRDRFKEYSNTIVHDFITQKRLGKILKDIDMAITRGGATTLWELYYFGIHSIIIPLKGSAGDHQKYNAMYFNEKFGSEIIDEDSNISEEILVKLTKYKDLRKAGLNLKNILKPLGIIKEEIEK